MRERLSVFAADVTRFGPLAVVSLATAMCLPSLAEFLSGRLAMTSMLGRYCAAFVFSYFGVKVVTSVLLRYTVKNAAQGGYGTERGEAVSGGHRSSDVQVRGEVDR